MKTTSENNVTKTTTTTTIYSKRRGGKKGRGGEEKKEEGRGKIEWTNGVKKREPRFRKYACVRAGARANMCSGAKLAELEPNAGIFDFCGHARNF